MSVSTTEQTIAERVGAPAPARSPHWLWLRLLCRRKIAVVGAVLLVLDVLVALFAPALARWDPQRLDVQARLSRPGETHWMGTDDVGRDVWSRVIHGTRLSMVVGGAVITEAVFAYPGIGRLAVEAVVNKDVPLIQAVVLTVGAAVLLLNILIDVVYVALDPRIRLA